MTVKEFAIQCVPFALMILTIWLVCEIVDGGK